MKRTYLRNFKQVYRDPETKEEKEYFYQLTIVRDTKDYFYRILNVTNGTLWANYAFETLAEALDFIDYHPHAMPGDSKEIELGRLY